MEYNFRNIEKKWQQVWKEKEVYKVSNNSSKPKYYVLDMFPYPSGAGLHVGHPLGYIASDIYSRYKRLKGFNVLHPMGFDSFGLPAEQYAIETGQHPAETTKKNIATFKSQLDKIGFCYDWSREVQTSDPSYYKWTQKLFLELFNSYFCNTCKQAKPISELIKKYETRGGSHFTAEQWNNFSKAEQEEILMKRRLAFSKFGEVNWCEKLGTVLANDEVVNGVSERGGHPVVKKKMRQWYLRITAYADRLLEGLEKVDFSESMKEMQRNWIGRSEGAEINFEVKSQKSKTKSLTVYTTRPDTIFGVDFMVMAPELELVKEIASVDQRQEVENYINYVKSRSDRERQAEVKQITGCFTGAYAINPFNQRKIPIWISEYVLAGYGTGAIMGVPCGDERDFKFAQHFNIPITNIIGEHYTGKEANPTKEAILENSDFLNGLLMKDAIAVANDKIEALGIGKRKVNFKMRDAGFSRQRYWGEPFPIIWKEGVAFALEETELPLTLPEVEKYSPGPEGEGPLANIEDWVNIGKTSPLPLSKGEGKERTSTTPNYYTTTPEQWKILSSFAKQNRKEATDAEDALWQELRNRKVKNCKFRRQHPIAGFIPDFVCIEQKLIIEVDGGYHNEKEQQEYDTARTEWLIEHEFKLIRFSNDEVLNQMQNVLQTVGEALSFGEGLGEVKRETSTMPGYAGSSWYFLRYMDPHNTEEFCNKKASDYWNQVDLYVGGTEHAVGHLLYSRMWTKVLFDLGYISFDEPFKKLLNQGMIQGVSEKILYQVRKRNNIPVRTVADYVEFVNKDNELQEMKFSNNMFRVFYSLDAAKKINNKRIEFGSELLEFAESYIPIKYTNNHILDISSLRNFSVEYENAVFATEGGFYISGNENSKSNNIFVGFGNVDDKASKLFLTKFEVEKMSKSKLNTVSPYDAPVYNNKEELIKEEDGLVIQYGADTFRMYEMFLGPIEQSKPWDTKGIEGVHRFIKKLWRLFFDELKGQVWNNGQATAEELKVLHKTIKKIEEDTERFSFNTAVSAFMVAVNDLSDLKCYKKEILEQILILLTPYAPHIAEELWHALGNETTILDASFPTFNSKYLVESEKEYPISINGKLRTTLSFPVDAEQKDIEPIVLSNEIVQKWLEGKVPKKIIFVKGKMINVVI